MRLQSSSTSNCSVSRYRTACMAAFSCHAIELLLCTTRLRLSECCNRNGSNTNSIHFSGDNYDCLSVLLMGIRFLWCSIRGILGSGILIRNAAWYTIRHLS